jgi:hypothetical protein
VSDIHCSIGQVCKDSACIDGCNSNDDCLLDQFCDGNNQCTTGCQSDDFCVEFCAGSSDPFCGFAEFCTNNNPSSPCESFNNGPLCEPCTNGSVVDTCDEAHGDNCLVYGAGPDDFGSDEYCATSCEGPEDCPSGFECSSVIIVNALCNEDNPNACGGISQCAGGLTPCLKSDEEECGYCPCHDTYNPCPENTCLDPQAALNFCRPFGKVCNITGESCQETSDCPSLCYATGNICETNADCVEIECVKYEGVDYGGCVTSNFCGLKEGTHCPNPDLWP